MRLHPAAAAGDIADRRGLEATAAGEPQNVRPTSIVNDESRAADILGSGDFVVGLVCDSVETCAAE
jgi:hypothetical protein